MAINVDKHQVHFIACGGEKSGPIHGDSILVQDSGENALIDSGPELTARTCLLPYLKERGAFHLKYVVISHLHSDHIDGLLNILRDPQFGTDTVLIDYIVLGQLSSETAANKPGTKTYTLRQKLADAGKYDEYREKLNSAIKVYRSKVPGQEIAIKAAGENSSLAIGKGKFYFYNTLPSVMPGEKSHGLNMFSMITKYVSEKGYKYLFTGDCQVKTSKIESGIWNILMAKAGYKEAFKDVDVLKMAHHGYRDGYSRDLTICANPKVTVMTAFRGVITGDDNKNSMQVTAENYIKDIEGNSVYNTFSATKNIVCTTEPIFGVDKHFTSRDKKRCVYVTLREGNNGNYTNKFPLKYV